MWILYVEVPLDSEVKLNLNPARKVSVKILKIIELFIFNTFILDW